MIYKKFINPYIDTFGSRWGKFKLWLRRKYKFYFKNDDYDGGFELYTKKCMKCGFKFDNYIKYHEGETVLCKNCLTR